MCHDNSRASIAVCINHCCTFFYDRASCAKHGYVTVEVLVVVEHGDVGADR